MREYLNADDEAAWTAQNNIALDLECNHKVYSYSDLFDVTLDDAGEITEMVKNQARVPSVAR